MGQRVDAARNREALLAAAHRVFAVHGATAPLDLVVQDAGLARGTLYRHFPDRVALIGALLEDRVMLLEQTLGSAAGPGRFEVLIRAFTAYLGDVPGLLTLMRASRPGLDRLAALELRVRGLITEVLDLAQQHGEVRAGLDVTDVLLLLAMLEGAMVNVSDTELPDRAERVVDLVLRAAHARVGTQARSD